MDKSKEQEGLFERGWVKRRGTQRSKGKNI